MLVTARQSAARAGLDARLRLAQGDATDFDPRALFGIGSFDRIIIPYALSMIPEWRATLAHSASLLAPNGSLHIVDFGDFSGLPGFFRTAMLGWLAMFGVHPRPDLANAVLSLSERQNLRAWILKRFRGYAIQIVVVAAPAPASARNHPLTAGFAAARNAGALQGY